MNFPQRKGTERNISTVATTEDSVIKAAIVNIAVKVIVVGTLVKPVVRNGRKNLTNGNEHMVMMKMRKMKMTIVYAHLVMTQTGTKAEIIDLNQITEEAKLVIVIMTGHVNSKQMAGMTVQMKVDKNGKMKTFLITGKCN